MLNTGPGRDAFSIFPLLPLKVFFKIYCILLAFWGLLMGGFVWSRMTISDTALFLQKALQRASLPQKWFSLLLVLPLIQSSFRGKSLNLGLWVCISERATPKIFLFLRPRLPVALWTNGAAQILMSWAAGTPWWRVTERAQPFASQLRSLRPGRPAHPWVNWQSQRTGWPVLPSLCFRLCFHCFTWSSEIAEKRPFSQVHTILSCLLFPFFDLFR